MKKAYKYPIHNDFKLMQEIAPVVNLKINGFINWNSQKSCKIAIRQKKELTIRTFDGEPLDLWVLKSKNVANDAPCLLYFHGGAFWGEASVFQMNIIKEYLKRLSIKIVVVFYRLSMKYPFPTPLKDCYEALKYVYNNPIKFGIDRNKIALLGDSAGGSLAAGVSLMARDLKGPHICGQLLTYPVLDIEQKTPSMKKFVDTPIWNAKANHIMWKIYMHYGDFGMVQYASPFKAESLANYPPTYIETAEFDCLRDEGINFAAALVKAGNRVVLRNTIGTCHGYDAITKSPISQESFDARIEFFKSVCGYRK